MKALNPYTHTCHIPAGAGHDPNQCPACRWAEQQHGVCGDCGRLKSTHFAGDGCSTTGNTRGYFAAMGIHFNNKGKR